jgi:hypothetical protein
VKSFSRIAVVVTVVTVGLLAGSGTAAAAPSCVGQSLTYQGANAFYKTLGFKNLGESFSTEAHEFGGIGKLQSTATKQLIRDCQAG